MQLGERNVDNLKNKKVSRIILVSIVIVFVLIISIMCAIIYVQGKAFRVYINGASVNLPQDMLIINDESGKVYVDIKAIASYLGYDSHNGEYKLFTEDTNKCYVDSKNETASFFLNSNKISKVIPDQTKNYEDYTITDPVISKNGKLYCTSEGIKIGFNVTFDYSKEQNKIEIYTLPYLVSVYNTTFKGYGYEGMDTDFLNQKAILYNMFVVKKDNNMYGVVDSKNKELISSKYKNMQFNENAREFYVQNTLGKVGIVTEEGVTKINLIYDQINLIDKNQGLYLAKSDSKFGVLGNTGNVVIYLEYDKIGLDMSSFQYNSITNQYLLFNNVIPVYNNTTRKWGAFDVTGKLIIPLEWDMFGCTEGSSTKKGNNVAIVQSYKLMVLGKINEVDNKKEKKYGIYDYKGDQVIVTALTSVYSVTSAGVDTYYMEYKENTLNVEKYVEDLYEQQGKNKPTDTI